MSRTINLIVNQGTDWSVNVIARTQDDMSVLDLVDYTSAQSQIRKTYTSVSPTATIGVSIHHPGTSNVDGVVMLSMPNATTAAIAAGRYLYDVEIVKTMDSKIFRIFEGFIDIKPEITKV